MSVHPLNSSAADPVRHAKVHLAAVQRPSGPERENHGGAVSAALNDGPGATFSFLIPCRALT